MTWGNRKTEIHTFFEVNNYLAGIYVSFFFYDDDDDDDDFIQGQNK